METRKVPVVKFKALLISGFLSQLFEHVPAGFCHELIDETMLHLELVYFPWVRLKALAPFLGPASHSTLACLGCLATNKIHSIHQTLLIYKETLPAVQISSSSRPSRDLASNQTLALMWWCDVRTRLLFSEPPSSQLFYTISVLC